MDEKRQEAYLKLIQSLLNCSSNSEINLVLNEHRELLDADLITKMHQEALNLVQQGNENGAKLLQNVAVQLAQLIGNTKGTTTQEYLHFLAEVLEATSNSDGDPEIVYSLIRANLDKLDENFSKFLRSWAADNLTNGDRELIVAIALAIFDFSTLIVNFTLGIRAINLEIAIAGYEVIADVFNRETNLEMLTGLQNNLGNVYLYRIKGNRADNLELALGAYNAALEVLNHKELPEDWAQTQNNLGSAYLERIKGDKSENIELAIAAYNAALEIRTRQEFPQDWAQTQNNLGNAYLYRIKEDRADNLELAIAAYNAALEIRTRLDWPQQWATTQINLGNAYIRRIKGKKAENLEQAIGAYNYALEIYTRQNSPQKWAAIQNNLGSAYSNRIKGTKIDNIELAIAADNAALEVYTRQRFPQNWAQTQTNLGNAYSKRIKGDKADNIELAIAAHKAALEVYTRQGFPSNWATTQTNLGNAYSKRIKGDKADNIELAIAAYNFALEVLNYQNFPQDWTTTQSNLGSAYLYRIRGERAENLELAIAAYKSVLEVRTPQNFPQDWATTQSNLGSAYLYRIRGERAENLELAIAACKSALEVRTREEFPQDWAQTQTNLGSAYSNRIKGDKVENLELAIAAYKSALEVLSRQKFPEDWGQTESNLGNAYLYRAYLDKTKDNRAESLELAIAAYKSALEVRTHQELPQDWAQTQNNLGNAYSDRIEGDTEENLELAIVAYKAALEVRTRQKFPQDWATTKINLGNAYLYRIKGEKEENLQLAIAAHKAALEVYTRQGFPQQYAIAQLDLGFAYQNTQQFPEACTAFASAIDTVESLRSDILSGDETKQKLAEEWNQLYISMVEVCLKLNKPTETIEYIERSKTRNLVELILIKDRHTIFPSEVVAQLDRLRDEIASSQYELQNATAENPTALAQHLQQLRQQRNELQDQYLPIGSGFQFESFWSTLSDRTAIVEFYITTDKLLIFIITKQTQQPIALSPDLVDLKKLETWANSYLKAYSSKKAHWQRRLTTRLNLLVKILHFDEIIELIPTECDQLTLIPHRFLHLLPLHALPLAGNSSLFERFPQGVSYAPSCQLLQLAQTKERPEFTHLFAVQNPTGDLSYTDIEVETIKSYFRTSNLLKQQVATKEAIDETSLNTFHCAHFSCHGYFNASKPRQSALILANARLSAAPTQPDTENYLSLANGGVLDLNKCLTLDKIFTLSLDKCRLVTLSACETGLIDFRNTSDEYIGLPSGFLYTGAASVVCSLWTVNDLSTAFLMIKFYENLQNPTSVAVALQQAQLWLRNLTKKELETWITQSQLNLAPAVKMSLNRRLKKMSDDAQPFRSPCHWAAFCAIGQ
ncbi:MAG: tetratricopeptide repeat protein [Symploca sp. SIO2D2]|nr:tetratricopeptide repeat protein [Symploca sp. SIO2D2]